jgi:hypothetical protein
MTGLGLVAWVERRKGRCHQHSWRACRRAKRRKEQPHTSAHTLLRSNLPSLHCSSGCDTTFVVFQMQPSTVGTPVALGSPHGDVSLVRAPVLVLRAAGEDGDHTRRQARFAVGGRSDASFRDVVATSGSVTRKKLQSQAGQNYPSHHTVEAMQKPHAFCHAPYTLEPSHWSCQPCCPSFPSA